MIKQLLKAFLFVGLIASPSFSYAQSEQWIQDGWKKFVENDYAAATDIFTQVIENTNNPEAYLARHYAYLASYQSDKAFNDLVRYVELADDPSPALRALWTFHGGDKSDDEIEFLEGLTEKYTGTIQALAYESLGTNARNTNELRDARKYFEELHTVDTWSAAGEFENISESGYNKNFGPLDHPESSATFQNKVGADVTWFNLKGPRHNKWMDLEYFFYASSSIIYTQNFCTSPIDQEVQFRLGVSGSVKVWVNDLLIFSQADERNNGLDSYVFNAKLNSGNNRILIQMGESEAGACNYMLRITDFEGNSIEDLTYSTAYAPYSKETAFQPQPFVDEVEEYFKSAIEANPENLLYYLLLNDYYQLVDNTNQAHKLLITASETFEGSNYILLQQLMAHVREGNSTQVSTIIEELKLRDPKNVLGLNLRFSDAMKIEDYESAREILEDLHAIQGMSENVYDKKIELASALENREEVISLAMEAYEEYPDNYTFVSLKYTIEKDVNNSPSSALRALDRYIDDHYNSTAMTKMAAHYFGWENSTGALKGKQIYQELVENEPIAVGYLSTLSRIEFAFRNYNAAIQYSKQCIEIAPYLGTYHARLAEAYMEMDRNVEAMGEYFVAIQLNPYDYDSRHELETLRTRSSIFDHFAEIDIYELIDEAPDASSYPEDNSCILLNQTQRVFYEGGGNEERHIIAIKVFNIEGVDYWKEYNVSTIGNQSGNIEKAEVVKASGARVPAETSGGRIVFEDLEPGDAIHLTYRLKSMQSGKLTEHFWGSEYLNYFIPSLHTKLEILLPKETHFQYLTSNDSLEPTIQEIGNYDLLYTWDAKDLPAVRFENSMPRLADAGMSVHYSTMEDWNFVSDWYTDLVSAKSKADFEVDMAVENIFPEGYEGLTDYEKAKQIHDFIVGNIRYRSVSFLQSGLIPQRASTTLSAKQGDCKDVSVLFATLCREVGLEADLVLINSRNNGQRDMILPSINFNHCIAAVSLDGSEEPYYVELTSDKISFATRTSDIEGAFALRIPLHSEEEVTAGILDIQTGFPTETYRQSDIHFEGSNMIVDRTSWKTGMRAAGMRNSYRDQGPDQQNKTMQEAITADYTSSKLNSLEFVRGLHENIDTVEYKYNFQANDVMSRISNMEIFEVPLTDKISSAPSYISSETRNYPILLWDNFSSSLYEETLVLEVPTGKTLVEVPSNVSISTDNFNYSIVYSKRGNKLTVTRRFEITEDIVATEDYEAFKSAMEKVVKADTQSLAFR